jgi:hypothetical protein
MRPLATRDGQTKISNRLRLNTELGHGESVARRNNGLSLTSEGTIYHSTGFPINFRLSAGTLDPLWLLSAWYADISTRG